MALIDVASRRTIRMHLTGGLHCCCCCCFATESHTKQRISKGSDGPLWLLFFGGGGGGEKEIDTESRAP